MSAEFVESHRPVVTLPPAHSATRGTRLTVNGLSWVCVQEGKHKFWERVSIGE